MTQIKNRYFEGERILYGLENADLDGITFGKGESPLKEAKNINLKNSIFQWKYPLWYDENVKVENTTFETMSRSGIWYTKNITIKNSALQAPKLFRRASYIDLDNVHFADAQETMWTCDHIKITNSQINGDYFGKDSKNIYLDHVSVVGNYVFDGAENIEVHNSTFVSKDAFWNCKNVTIYDSTIDGEYLAWNTDNIKFINCKIESDQGLNYIDQLEIKNSALIHTDLAFEKVSNMDVELTSKIDSVKNPISGKLRTPEIGTLIIDLNKIDPTKTTIDCPKIDKKVDQSDMNQEPKD
ncbi:DUF3737 family protein [Lactobacillus ultunensis]|uniref:DUF3737 family protein n=1 Tax=Lactobacillus ultunensis DSM 16047 TaxID=525365 RepID=C2EM77_9LACO|nr:DUF3737 family protein [Lactobacillus ultunensis]EEJ72354.1 hypothetical protein HMPREF0548_0773 [Lactobacillus ultunensis DSM 16047]KRL81163.1 hypothetical protein FC57_GL000844 [Lactobacillus ultunensis DSM 16047]QQP27955.1 DUF3737 family protein [Lactobacillus ultunensis]